MVIVQLFYNDFPSMVKEAKRPSDLRYIFKLADLEGYTINIVRGWEYNWVQNAWLNWQETKEAA